ncbi:regulator of g protein signaling-related [Anaeramoeba flamelloides]|uniref:Regulator of g protein signaling-related n=1 Tax=Anaeramoeba flamelloides TaxID=1746091 RepID=A0AAV7ZLN9_9EUKA|nr:regulator of g protein signaling-related [Anaeramoeba flamelloides]
MGNFSPFVFVSEKETKSFLQNVKQSKTPICIWTSDMELLKANEACKKFFDTHNVQNISQLEPKTQPYFQLSNIEAAKFILSQATENKSEKKSYFWLFQNKEQEIWTKLYIKLLKYSDQIAIQVFLKKTKKPKHFLINGTDLITKKPKKIEKKYSSKPQFRNYNELQTTNIKLMEKYQRKYKGYLTKLQQQIDENEEFQSLLEQIILERNKLLRSNAKYVNPDNVDEEYEKQKQIYDQDLELIDSKYPQIPELTIKETLSDLVQLKSAVQLKRIEEYIYEYQSELLDTKYQLIINQIKKIKIMRNFNNIKIKTYDVKNVVETFENQYCYQSNSKFSEEEDDQESNNEKKQKKHKKKSNNDDENQEIEPSLNKRLTLKKSMTYDNYSEYFASTTFNFSSSSDDDHEYSRSEMSGKSTSECNNSHMDSTDSLTESANLEVAIIPFATILSSEKYYNYFMRYLVQISCSENLKFYLEVNNYKKLNRKKLARRAKKICNNFILPGSYSQINVSSGIVNVIKENVKNKKFCSKLFDKAQNYIFDLMNNDSYFSFVTSPIYSDLLKSIDRDKKRQFKIEHAKQIVNNFDLLKITNNLDLKKHTNKKYKLIFNWKETGTPQIHVEIKNNKHLINFDIDSSKLLGGKQTAPNSISLFIHSITSGFLQYFLYNLTKNKIPINDILIETVCKLNYKNYFVELQNGENFYPININIVINSNSSKGKIMEIFEKTKQNCPILNLIQGKNPVTLDIDYQFSLVKYKMKKNPKILNNIQINKVKKFRDKSIKKKHPKIQSNIVFNKWSTELKQIQSQCQGIIQFNNNDEELLTTTLPRAWGGKSNSLDYVQFLLVGLGTNYLTQLAVQSSLHNVPIKDLSVNIEVEKGWGEYFTIPSSNQSINRADIFKDLKINSNLQSFVHESLINKIKETTDKTCPALQFITNPNNINLNLTVKKIKKHTDSAMSLTKNEIINSIF